MRIQKSGFLTALVLLLSGCGGGGGGSAAPAPQVPSLSVGPSSGSEAGDPPEVVFPVTLSAPAGAPVTVSYRSEAGTAAAGADFVAADGTLTIPAGGRSAEIRVSVIDDDETEGDETFEVRLSNPINATLGTAAATGTIRDDDPAGPPELSLVPASVEEAADARLTFAVVLSAPGDRAVTVAYRTEDGTATAGDDYVAAADTLTIPAGATTAEIAVAVLDDAVSESSETLLLRLSDPVNATLAMTSATGTITDDDAPPATVGLDGRPPNATCLAPERSADATGPIQVSLEPAFPDLPSFVQPTGLVQAPGADGRWYVLEKAGRVRVFPDDPAAADAPVWLDISSQVNARSEGGLLGLAFDPDWPAVAEIYVSYTGTSAGGMRSVVSRFVPDDPVAPGSWREEQLITVDQDFDNHNGGHIAFDGDGRLILGLGDGGSAGDPNGRAQDTTRLLGAFLRLEVRGVPFPAPGYRIPAGNPFAGNPVCGPGGNAQPCPEILAWGFRNPWRWSIDPDTGALWAGDVGQGSWEEVDLVEAGGNYGWDCREGAHDFQPENCVGVGLVEPVAEYSHSLGNSITGGYVYRGTRIPALAGRYVFGDFGSGRIWALRNDGTYALEELVDSNLNVSSFGQGADGELYVVNFGGDIRRLAASGGVTDPVPDLLSETGCTAAGDATRPAPGLVPYGLNAPFWSDGAQKRRWIGLPDGAVVDVDGGGNWQFPPGSVLVKQFALAGQPAETRLLMRHPDGEWAGYTYAWNDAGTDATRVRGGLVRTIAGQDWIYPSESQCLECHTQAAGVSLGLETAQLNGDLTYPSTGRTANQLATLEHIGFLADPLPGAPGDLPALADPADPAAPVDARARAYLHTNCSQCHRPGGPTPVDMDLRWTVSLADTNTCDVMPAGGGGGIPRPRLIAPGDADRSVIVERMRRRDVRGMPPIGSALVDGAGVIVVSSWIDSLSGCN